MSDKSPNSKLTARANWLRAAVLGSIDGIVSVAGIVVGVAGATDAKPIIFVAGLAGLLAGALSMAAGEYVSVSTQRDIEREHHTKINSDDEGFTNPWHAALASAIAFIIGSIIPLSVVMLPIGKLTIVATFASVLIALFITGWWSAKLAGTSRSRAVVRVMIGGSLAMIITYSIGSLFNI